MSKMKYKLIIHFENKENLTFDVNDKSDFSGLTGNGSWTFPNTNPPIWVNLSKVTWIEEQKIEVEK